MKSLLSALAITTALTFPGLALAQPVTLSTTLNNYGGDGAYIALYVTDAQGAYAGSLWMAGGKSKYYQHLSGWYRATGGDTAEIDGITAQASVQAVSWKSRSIWPMRCLMPAIRCMWMPPSRICRTAPTKSPCR